MNRLTVVVLVGLWGCPEGVQDEMVRVDWHPDGPFLIDRYEHPNALGRFPTSGVSLAEAKAACVEAGKHLCTATEWRAACAGPEGRRWPWGDRPVPRICRLEETAGGHTSTVDAGANEDGNHPGIAASGAYMDCRTPEGVHDLAGNLEEWVQDDWQGRAGSLEGGAWYTRQSYADCSGRYSRAPDYRLSVEQGIGSAGFRCCKRDGEVTPELVARDADQRSTAPPVLEDPGADEVALGGGRFMDRWAWPNRPGVLPAQGVSWTTASEACAGVGKRLCGVAEWERACGGPEALAFPYGEAFVPDACPSDSGQPALLGAHFACVSPLGASDLVGNGWEWTATPLDLDGLRAGRGRLRELRGGGWGGDPRKARCRPADGYPAAPETSVHEELGFRCCRGPVPGAAPTSHAARELACPDGMVGLEAEGRFCIDQHEHPGAAGSPPLGGLDATEAADQCGAVGKRLCTRAEWSAACAGAEGRRWPDGDTWTGACHVDDEAPGPRAVGAGRCASPEGVHELSGNLWEWTLGPAGPELRGGGWLLGAGLAQCRATATPPSRTPGLAEWGVRCCADPVVGTAPG